MKVNIVDKIINLFILCDWKRNKYVFYVLAKNYITKLCSYLHTYNLNIYN